jgi:hypothetical protein
MPTTQLAKDRFNHAIQALNPGVNTQVTVSTGGSNRMPVDIGIDTVVVRLISTVDCRIDMDVGTLASASAASFLLSAGLPEYFRVPQTADGYRVAGLATAAAGLLDVTEMY